jgi:hypothetical protein
MAHSTGTITWNTDPTQANPWPLEGRGAGSRRAYLSEDTHYKGDYGWSLFQNVKDVERNVHIAKGCCLPDRESCIQAVEEANNR